MQTRKSAARFRLAPAALLLLVVAFSNTGFGSVMVPVYIDLSGRLGQEPNIDINTDPANPNTPEALFTTDDSGVVEVWVNFYPFHIESPEPFEFGYTAAIQLDLPSGYPVGDYIIQDFVGNGMGAVVPLHDATVVSSDGNPFPDLSFTLNPTGPLPFPVHSYGFRLESDVLPADVDGIFIKNTGRGLVGVWVPEPTSLSVWTSLTLLSFALWRRRRK